MPPSTTVGNISEARHAGVSTLVSNIHLGDAESIEIFSNGMRMKSLCVYILVNKRNGTLYIGVRPILHNVFGSIGKLRLKALPKKYNVKIQVWYEQYQDMNNAITRKKSAQAMERAWKLRLIEKSNPDWSDLYESIVS